MQNPFHKLHNMSPTLTRGMVIISLVCTLALYNIMQSNYYKIVEAYRNSTPSNLKQETLLKVFEGNVISLNSENGTLIFKANELNHKIMINYNVENIDSSALENEIINANAAFVIEIDLNERQFRETHNAYEFDYQKYLYANNIIGQYRLKRYEISHKAKKSIFAYFNSKRMKLMQPIEKNKVSEYFNALILGCSDSLSEKELFRKLGISHVFAISGMHFGLIYAFLYKLIKGPRCWKSVIIVSLLICYWGVIGFSYSAGRAVFLVIYIEVSKMISRKMDVLSAVALTNLVLLFVFPSAVLAVSYQLSFIAYLLIAYVYQRLNRHKEFNKIIGSLYFVFFIQIAFLPIQLYYFNEVNLFAFLPNLLIVPLISTLFPVLFLVPILGKPLMWLIEHYIFSIEFLSRQMPLLVIKGQAFTPNQFKIIMISALGYLLYKSFKMPSRLIFKKSKWIILFSMMVLLVVSGFNFSKSEIHFFDVGHGDSELIIEDQLNVLIDTGDQYTDLSQMLLKRDIYNIDALILSHAHSDHVGGFKKLTESCPIHQIYCNQETYEVIKADISAATEVIVVKSPIEITLNYAKLTLVPTVSEEPNDNAIAVWYDSEAIKGIFLGDISGPVYEKLSCVLGELDFVKISHHGSKTGISQFFLVQHPTRYAIISHNEKYLMPNKGTLELLTQLGVEIYETYNCGEIVLNNKGIFPYLKH